MKSFEQTLRFDVMYDKGPLSKRRILLYCLGIVLWISLMPVVIILYYQRMLTRNPAQQIYNWD